MLDKQWERAWYLLNIVRARTLQVDNRPATASSFRSSMPHEGIDTVDDDGNPLWRMAPSPHGKAVDYDEFVKRWREGVGRKVE